MEDPAVGFPTLEYGEYLINRVAHRMSTIQLRTSTQTRALMQGCVHIQGHQKAHLHPHPVTWPSPHSQANLQKYRFPHQLCYFHVNSGHKKFLFVISLSTINIFIPPSPSTAFSASPSAYPRGPSMHAYNPPTFSSDPSLPFQASSRNSSSFPSPYSSYCVPSPSAFLHAWKNISRGLRDPP